MQKSTLAQTAAHFSRFLRFSHLSHIWVFLREHVFTRENAWVILVSVMLLMILLLGAMSSQPHFVYSGF